MKHQIVDLLPNAEFAAVKDVATQSSPDMLVSIPCLLQPGTVAGNFQDTVSSKVLPLPYIFLALWLGVITAAVATGVLLGGALRLSDRRAAFVAAVTHELRTPLTTLQLYSEMLGSNMIQAEETKQSYLQTLQNEVQRIVHLVENVFAYARLEKGRRPRSLERLSVTDVMARSSIRLQKLAERAEMELVLEPCEAWEAEVLGDPSMIEQILVNLVDNAGKYAQDASDRRIFIRAKQKGTRLHISVEDRGGGFDKLKRRQSPFSKTVQQAAESAPGIGLGLAISQRFAHELGGKLLLENIAGGARVTLVLPIVE
jgi:signal transduction histidine kinase